MANPPKKKLTKQQTKEALPSIKEFNGLAKLFMKLLGQQIEHKEKQMSNIQVLLNDIKLPQVTNRSNINIQTIDMNRTTVKKRGDASFNQLMNWEDQMRKQKRGLML